MSLPEAPHGTVSAYRRHLRRDQKACASCRAANAKAHLEYKKRRKLGIVHVGPVIERVATTSHPVRVELDYENFMLTAELQDLVWSAFDAFGRDHSYVTEMISNIDWD